MRLKKSEDASFEGVCAGIAEWMGVDPVLIRAIWVIGTLFFCAPCWIIAYLVLMFIMPEHDE